MKKHLFAFLALIGSAIILFGSSENSFKLIELPEVKKHYDSKTALFLDARPNIVYLRGTIPGALNFDVKEYPKLKQFLPADKAALIVSFCNGPKCEHSDHLANMLIKDGYSNVLVYRGGFPEWQEKKLPPMGIMKECKDSKGAYTPKTKPTTINGVTFHLLKQDDKTMIDQFWFAPILLNKIPDNIQMVDVRKPKDFNDGHLKNAINIPLIGGKIDASKLPKNKLNVLYCHTGVMSTEAVASMEKNDGSTVYLDAKVNCKADGNCTVIPNDPL